MGKESGLKEKVKKNVHLKVIILKGRRKDMVNSIGQMGTSIEENI